MEEVRQETDKKLMQLDDRVFSEIESLRNNLASDNPADWSKVGHSCRSILTLLADRVYPASKIPYKTRDGKPHSVTEDKYLNRLWAFIDSKATSKDDNNLLKVEIEMLGNNLDTLNERICKLEHDSKSQKITAKMIAIKTYLLISDILRLME